MAGSERTRMDAGVAFPASGDGRSTTAAGRATIATAARALDPALADEVAAETDWRRRYLDHVRALVAAEVRATDPDAAAHAGLTHLHDTFDYLHLGAEVALRDAATLDPAVELHTHVVTGTGPHTGLAVPYRGRLLAGDDLRRRLDTWVRDGVVEPSFAAAIGQVLDEPGWLDLDDLTVVVLGAGAEMGPVAALGSWGATLALVDLPRSALWRRVLGAVDAGCGRALVPVRTAVAADATPDRVAEVAGLDLVTGVPEVVAWLAGIDGPLTVGSYVYADGADHVRAALAADAVTDALLTARAGDVTLAGLLTPTDVYAVPAEVVEAARSRAGRHGPVRTLVRTAARGRAYAPNYEQTLTTPDGREVGLADCLVPQQGPNYALAKRLQQWRFRVARRAGVPVSANVAPATRTRSVTSNRVLAAAYAGAHRFDVEVFEPATSTVLLAALLVHDLRTAGGTSGAAAHPLTLFSDAAAHGGMWRQPYAPRSVLPIAALAGLPRVVRS